MKETDYIGKNIRYYRKKRGLTQQVLADKIGVSWEMISRYERGKSLPLKRISKLAEALDVNPAQLVGKRMGVDADLIESPDIRFVPLFIKLPEKQNFTKENTPFRYLLPQKLSSSTEKIIAFDVSSSLQIKTVRISKRSIVFVMLDVEVQEDSLIVYILDGTLFVDTNSNLSDDIEIVGKIVCQEEFFE